MRRVLVDSGPLAALFDADDHWHARSREFLRGFRGELLCSAANVTEAVWVASNASFAVDAKDFARYRLQRGRRILNLLSAVSR